MQIAASLQRIRPACAHEGPVYVAAQNRLYFTTKPDLPARDAHVAIQYWDLHTDAVETWLPDARMANGMSLSCDASCLLVCEQGDRERPAAIARYRLDSQQRSTVVDAFEGKPFNSPNKVAEVRPGTYVFTDPDYGRRQLFRPTRLSPKQVTATAYLSPEAFASQGRPPGAHPPRTYLLHDGALTVLPTGLTQPHGLALSPDRSTLYISDTAADDGVGGFDESRPHSVHRFDFDSGSGAIGEGTRIASVPKGIPDGMACDSAGRLFCAVGDGVRVYSPAGELLHHLAIEEGAVNLYLDEARGRLFVTTDESIQLFALSDI